MKRETRIATSRRARARAALAAGSISLLALVVTLRWDTLATIEGQLRFFRSMGWKGC